MIANVDSTSIATSVRLSTTSIASNASSHSSGGSADDVLPHLKSRSNSSEGTSVSGSIGEQPLMPESITPVIQAEVVVEADSRPLARLAVLGPSMGAIPKSIRRRRGSICTGWGRGIPEASLKAGNFRRLAEPGDLSRKNISGQLTEKTQVSLVGGLYF